MLRRLLVASFAVIVIAGCGSGSPTASPSEPASTTAPAVASAAPAAAPTSEPSAGPNTAGPTTMMAACNAVGLRKLPSSKGALVVRIGAGTSVRVAEVVSGEAYKAGTCGSDGNTWLKIDQVGGKGVKSLYGVAFAYSAAGFFK